MELLDASRSIVLVMDLQGKLMNQIHRPELVLAATGRLLRLAELFGVPVLLTEQYPKGLGPTHPDVASEFAKLSVPHHRMAKTSFGCCGDPAFEPALEFLRPEVPPAERQMVVAGIEAHVCVMQTVLELRRSNHSVHLCWECVSSRGVEYRKWALARMQQAGAVVTNHESVGFEWARDKGHDRFRAMSELFKEGQPA